MGIRVGVGFGRFPFEKVSDFREWLDLCEESQIDSVWQSDRILSRDPHLEPLTLLSVIAGATRRLKIGMNAVVLGFRDPVTFARQCASLDVLSEGRLLPMVGVGRSSSREWKSTGRSPKGRGARANEALEIITRLWREENVTFEGEHYRVENATICPRPIQNPLPLWIGGSSEAAIRRTVRYGTGWLAPLESPEEAGKTVAAIRAEGEACNRPVPSDHFGATILYRVEASARIPAEREGVPEELAERLRKTTVIGKVDHVLDRIAEYHAVGIDKFIAIPLAESPDDVMEKTRLLASEIIPALPSISSSAVA
jgi:probable F420-dependent oxidoreductase